MLPQGHPCQRGKGNGRKTPTVSPRRLAAESGTRHRSCSGGVALHFTFSVSRVENAIVESKRWAFILTANKIQEAHSRQCDRQVPCGHVCISCSYPRTYPANVIMQCVARKVPELCKAYTPGKTDQDIGVRLSRLEHIIEMALPQFCSSGTPGSSAAIGDHHRSASIGLDDDMQSQHEEQDPSGGTFQSGKWYGNSASSSVATASVLEQVSPASCTYTFVLSIHTS